MYPTSIPRSLDKMISAEKNLEPNWTPYCRAGSSRAVGALSKVTWGRRFCVCPAIYIGTIIACVFQQILRSDTPPKAGSPKVVSSWQSGVLWSYSSRFRGLCVFGCEIWSVLRNRTRKIMGLREHGSCRRMWGEALPGREATDRAIREAYLRSVPLKNLPTAPTALQGWF